MKKMKKVTALLIAVMLMVPLLGATVSTKAEASTTKLVAITFDDGSSQYTETLLDGLESRGVVATFFMCGENGSYGVKNYNKYLSRMVADGDQLANHTWSHNASVSTLSSQINQVGSYLTNAMGGNYNYLVRIPGGANSEAIRSASGHPLILWSVDTLDWKYRNATTVYNNIINNTTDGSIILLHDIYSTSVQGALSAIDTLKSKGYEFVTVSELFRRRGITLQNGTVYSSAPNKGTTLPAYSAPTIVEDGGNVTVNANNDGVTLRYTTDGSMPNLGSSIYNGNLSFNENVTLKVAGFDSFGTRTPVATATITGKPAYPQISSYSNGYVSLSCSTTGAKIYYTTDGSSPTTQSTLYNEDFAPGTVTKAIAVSDRGISSGETTFYKTEQGDLFYDVPNTKWYYQYVGNAVYHGWMTGTGNYIFAPDSKVTRAMLVTMLYSMAGKPTAGGSTSFSDVKTGKWYSNAVSWASANGIVSGYTDGTFKPDTAISREQMAAILYKYAQFCGADVSGRGELRGFDDSGNISKYATEAIQWCVYENIMSGTSSTTLDPKGSCTRAQCATMLSAFYTEVNRQISQVPENQQNEEAVS